MKLLTIMLMSLSLLSPASAQSNQKGAVPGADGSGKQAQNITIARSGSQPSTQGQAECSNGAAPWSRLRHPDLARYFRRFVEFPLIPFVILISCGIRMSEIKAGDVVRIPPGRKHWHGATRTAGMTHFALQEQLNGKVVERMEKVSDDQYKSRAMMKIRLTTPERVLTATPSDNEITRDFVSLLPLTLTMKDLFNREKFAHLPRAISDRGERTHSYQVGEVIYWSPGPDVAIYYRHDGQAIPDPGSIVIGKIDSGVEALNIPGSVNIKMELIDKGGE